jgi:arginine decarboxylase
MALVTFAHDEADIDRLLTALDQLAREHDDAGDDAPPHIADPGTLVTEQAMRPRDAFHMTGESVAAADAVGRISCDIVTPYPPGIPVLAPGEVIAQASVDHLEEFVALGGFVEGATDQDLNAFRVVPRE